MILILGLHFGLMIFFDDIVSNPIASLPKVFSPSKVTVVENKIGEKLPDFYSNLNNSGGCGCRHN